MSTTYLIKSPACNNAELKLIMKRNSQKCEICTCGFPENETVYEWSI